MVTVVLRATSAEWGEVWNELAWLDESRDHPECDTRAESEKKPGDPDTALRLLNHLVDQTPECAQGWDGETAYEIEVSGPDADEIDRLTGIRLSRA